MPEIQHNLAYDCCDKYLNQQNINQHPALFYVAENGKSYSLKIDQIARLSNRFANILQQLNIQTGDRFILHLPNIPFFIIAFLGCLKCKVIPIPVSAELTLAELNFMIQDSGAKGIFSNNVEVSPLANNNLHVLVCENKQDLAPGIHRFEDLLKNASCDFEIFPTDPEDPAFMLYTSGTTGISKGVVHAHRSIAAHDERIQHWQGLKKGDVVFNTSSLNWSYALTGAFLDAWRNGIKTVLYNGNLNAKAVFKILKTFKVNTFMSVPALFRRLLQYMETNPVHLNHLRFATSAGEKIAPELKANFLIKTGVPILEGLGMSENSVYITERMGEDPQLHSCGKVYFADLIKILDPATFQICASNEIGVLAIHRHHPGLMLGYWQNGKVNQDVFKQDWFLTGDLAYQNAQGNIFFQERSDDIIKIGGYKISPLEIEGVFVKHPEVVACVSCSHFVEAGKTLHYLYIVPKNKDSSNLKNLLFDYAKQNLAHYKIPHEIIFTKELPKTSNGKLKRKN